LKIEIPAIVKPIPLSEYHESMSDDLMYMWVNPPRAKLNELDKIRATMIKAWANVQKASRPKKFFPSLLAKIGIGSFGDRSNTINELDKRANEHYGWWAEMLSKHEEQYNASDIREMAESDPFFWEWFLVRATRVRDEWRIEQKKKAVSRPPMSPPVSEQPTTSTGASSPPDK
jgi:hypothetical protein